jgi:tripartite-type tricarboxylate transporter receptor subunit TctC
MPQPSAAQPAGTIDKPVTIYVAGTAGGGIDLYARASSAVISATIFRVIPR